jgi:putative endonuclease
MKKYNFEKGRLGEGIAKSYLEDLGYELIEANYKNYLGEIDLIMKKKGKSIVFVEVKLKVGEDFGRPEEMLSATKIARVQMVAEAFLTIHRKEYASWNRKIEAICIVLNPDESLKRISHYTQF